MAVPPNGLPFSCRERAAERVKMRTISRAEAVGLECDVGPLPRVALVLCSIRTRWILILLTGLLENRIVLHAKSQRQGGRLNALLGRINIRLFCIGTQ